MRLRDRAPGQAAGLSPLLTAGLSLLLTAGLGLILGAGLSLAGCAGAARTAEAPRPAAGASPAARPIESTPDSTDAPADAPPLRPAGDQGFRELAVVALAGCTKWEVEYRSGDLLVRGFLTVPEGAGLHPAVIFNHGGVSGVSADMNRRSADLARLGYVVLAPAYRGEGGSEGVVEVAAGEVDDVLAAAAILARHPRVDSTRVAVTGSSHGALISVLAAAREPERFRCVVEACGVMDVVAWYRYLVENDFDVSDSLSVAVYGRGPEDKPEAFRVRSAVRVADRIRVPVLIQHGMVDRTVPVEQARIFETALRDAGHQEVTRREYPLLGHAFWFWNDPRYHTAAEILEAETAWDDFTAFLGEQLKP